MSKVYSAQEVASHNSEKSCWVVHDDKVYDVSGFVADHPGGEEYILDHAGQDITALMKDELEHLHSDGAYEMLEEFLVGRLENGSSPGKPEAVGEEDMEDYIKETDIVADKKAKFLDLSQPLLWQLWNSDFSIAFYLEQVHIPRHVSGSARIFGSPFLEVFSKTPWYLIPIIWLPIIAYNVHRSLETGLNVNESAALFVAGIFLWSVSEYGIHRFLFHLDDLLPDTTFWQCAHFLLHGVHHYLPIDKLRLVMPPALAFALATPINAFVHLIMPTPKAYAAMAGLLFGYVLYDLVHYYLHHAKVFKIHFKEMKTYHLAHHYKDFQGGYGITSKFWDRVFNTELKL